MKSNAIDIGFHESLHQRTVVGDQRPLGRQRVMSVFDIEVTEIGHHIQTLTGVSAQLQAARQRAGEREANALSVRQELQADCYAGVWGHYAAREGLLEPGDAEEGLRAAAAIGDDRLQRQSQGTVVPESFTHGSSEQRVEWLRRGLDSGRIDSCNTFGTGSRY